MSDFKGLVLTGCVNSNRTGTGNKKLSVPDWEATPGKKTSKKKPVKNHGSGT